MTRESTRESKRETTKDSLTESANRAHNPERTRDKDIRHVYRTNHHGIVEIHADSLKCLNSGIYLNDTIIQFYNCYLINEICSPEMASKIHIFDPIFYKLLKDTFQSKAIDQVKWKQLSKWFNGVDIFAKSFLIFPVCEDDHWLAIVVCHPNDVRLADEDPLLPDQSSESLKRNVPGIIVMDSLGLNKPLVSKEVREFLDFEWRTRLTKIKDFSYHALDQYHPPLPKQTNAFDCGIFMLAYLKSFVLQPEKFYRLVVKRGDELHENLAKSICTSLSESSRESLKSLINRVCKIRSDN